MKQFAFSSQTKSFFVAVAVLVALVLLAVFVFRGPGAVSPAGVGLVNERYPQNVLPAVYPADFPVIAGGRILYAYDTRNRSAILGSTVSVQSPQNVSSTIGFYENYFVQSGWQPATDTQSFGPARNGVVSLDFRKSNESVLLAVTPGDVAGQSVAAFVIFQNF